MLSSYDLLLGLALLHEKNMRQPHAVVGWSGVLVKVAGKQVLIEQENIKEIIHSVNVTRVIDHREWLVGLLGYEGTIIPLVELRTLVHPGEPSLGLQNRSLLVIAQKNGDIGLLVDKILGSHDYWSDDDLSDFKHPAEGCAKVSFTHRNQAIEVCDIEKLATMIGLRKERVDA